MSRQKRDPNVTVHIRPATPEDARRIVDALLTLTERQKVEPEADHDVD